MLKKKTGHAAAYLVPALPAGLKSADGAQWAHGFHIKFGWYAWSPGDGAKRVARPATRLLASLFAELPGRMAGLRAKAPATANGKPPAALEVGVGAGARMDNVDLL